MTTIKENDIKILFCNANIWFRRLLITVLLFLFDIIGYILSICFITNNFKSGSNEWISSGLNEFKLADIINYVSSSIFKMLGYRGTQTILSAEGIVSIVSLVFCFVICYSVYLSWIYRSKLNSYEVFIIIFTIIQIFLIGTIVTLIGHNEDRYLTMSIVFLFSLFGISCKYFAENNEKMKNLLLSIFLLCAIFQSSLLHWWPAYTQHEERVQPERNVAQWLVKNGYKNGYATYWRGDNMVEQSNGKLEIWLLNDYYGSGRGEWWDLEILKWGQDIRHSNITPQGRVFLVLAPHERACIGENTELEDNHLVEIIDNYYIYDFDSYDDFARDVVEVRENSKGE